MTCLLLAHHISYNIINTGDSMKVYLQHTLLLYHNNPLS